MVRLTRAKLTRVQVKLMPIQEEEDDITKDEELSTCDPSSDGGDEGGDDADSPPALRPPPGLEVHHGDALAAEVARIKAENIRLRVEAAKTRLANANAWLQSSATAMPPKLAEVHSAVAANTYNPPGVWYNQQNAWYGQHSMNWTYPN